MIVPVIWQSYNPEADARVQWDCGFIRLMLDRSLWRPTHGIEFEDIDGFDGIDALPKTPEGAVVIVPAQHNLDHVEDLNRDLEQLGWCIVMLVGDEHHLFPWRELHHDHMFLWVMTPHPGLHDDPWITPIIDGFRVDTPDMLNAIHEDLPSPARRLAWSFTGQVNSNRRHEWVEALSHLPDGELLVTPGFTQGLPRSLFLQQLLETRVAPCPGGVGMPSSFRLYEALEAGCVPLVDSMAGQPRLPMDGHAFWDRLLPGFPAELIIDDPSTLKDWIRDLSSDNMHDGPFYGASARASAWWQGYKRDITHRLDKQVIHLSGKRTSSHLLPADDRITVLIPTSPIPSHPSTEIIEETVESVRAQLPDAEIIIMCDGVRPEQMDRRIDYREYLYRLTRLCEHRWHNVLPVVMDEWLHQAEMTVRTLRQEIETGFVLFVEHDTPIYGDIPWTDMLRCLNSDKTDVIRLMHESHIHPEHAHLMFDQEPIDLEGLPVVRTMQWSQRPHLAATQFYVDLLESYFTASSRAMIEDRIHGAAQDDPEGIRIAIFHPEGDIKRSWHTDGRGEDPKYEMIF